MDPARPHDSNTQTGTHTVRDGGVGGTGGRKKHEISRDQVVAGGEEKRAA